MNDETHNPLERMGLPSLAFVPCSVLSGEATPVSWLVVGWNLAWPDLHAENHAQLALGLLCTANDLVMIRLPGYQIVPSLRRQNRFGSMECTSARRRRRRGRREDVTCFNSIGILRLVGEATWAMSHRTNFYITCAVCRCICRQSQPWWLLV